MFYIYGKKGNKFGVKDSKDGVVEFYTKEAIFDMATRIRIYGVYYDREINPIKFNFLNEDALIYKLKILLKMSGVQLGESDETEEDVLRLTWSTRFLGGFDNWFCSWGDDSDKCDADCLDHDVCKIITRVCKQFKEETGITVFWFVSEKGWSDFYFY